MANQLNACTYMSFSKEKISTVGFVTYMSIKCGRLGKVSPLIPVNLSVLCSVTFFLQ